MESLKNKVASVATGDAYDKPAKTDAGAFTTQDSSNAATTAGTSADPNSTGSALGDKTEQGLETVEKKEGLPDNANVNKDISREVDEKF